MKLASSKNWSAKASAAKIEDELARRTPTPTAEILT